MSTKLFDLTGRRALVTGSSQGIGLALAKGLAAAGADVVLNGRDEAKLAAAAKEIGAKHTLAFDATDHEAVRKAVDAFEAEIGPIDILFNCAGFVHAGSILECSEADWDFAFDLNAKAMYRTIRAFLPGMLSKGAGSIINMSSAASSIKGVPNRFAYSASKAAVIGMTKAIAADFCTKGVRCNAICPGTVDSPSLAQRISTQAQHEGRSVDEVRAAFIARQPMGRVGKPEEIAALVAYLASDDAGFTTGQAHVIDGGWAN